MSARTSLALLVAALALFAVAHAEGCLGGVALACGLYAAVMVLMHLQETR